MGCYGGTIWDAELAGVVNVRGSGERFVSEAIGSKWEGTKETYYEALLWSSQRWESGHHDLTPWQQYNLGVLLYAYREFEARVGELITAPGAKSQMVQSAIETFGSGDTFSISELERICPTVSRETIRRVLRNLRDGERVECLGTGRDARWQKL